MSKKINVAYASVMSAMMLTSMVGIMPQRAEAALTPGGGVSLQADGITAATNPATGFPLWYKDANGVALQLCLGLGADGVGVIDPKCVLPGQPSPIDPVTAALTNFPGESFYSFAEAPLTINGAAGRFRLLTEAAFATDPAVVAGQQVTFARASLFTSQAGVFPANSSFHVVYPFGSFDFSTDATGGMIASNPNPLIAPFQPNGGNAKEIRAEDGPGAAGDFKAIFATNNTGMTTFLRSATLNIPGYLGDGVSETPVIGGTNGNVVTITRTGGDPALPFVVTGGTNWIIAGKVADTVAPVITITGGAASTVTAGTAYVEQGATAFDAFDAATTTATIASSTVPAGKLVLGSGPFTVTYTASDNAGNIATATRTVTVVPDTTAPVITINGAVTSTVKVGTPFVDAGATALDNVDGAVAVTATGTVNTAIAGVYTITYTATDSSGLVGSATRTVTVAADVAAPVITINGANPATVSFGAAYNDAGATALDAFDGVRTVTVTGLPIDTRTAVSPVTITYTASDLTGNTATATRIVNISSDLTAPVITLNGANPMTIEMGTVFTDPGATALDDVDGVRAVNATGTVNTAVAGANTITYTASDTSGNQATVIRTVNVATDATAPVITINGANPATILIGGTYVDAGATAVDNIDGPIASSSIAVTGLPISTTATGTFSVVYTVADAAGNVASSTRTVKVVSDMIAPVVTINGAGVINIALGGSYSDPGANAVDDTDGNITNKIVVNNAVNTSAAGVYTVTYTVSDAAGNSASASRTVNVINPSTGGGGGGGGGFGGSITPSYIAPVVSAPSATGPSVSAGQGSVGQVLGVSRFLFSRDLRQGARGDDVRELQERLRSEGFFTGEATGFFGPMTREALRKFQDKHGIAGEGVLGPITRGRLNQGSDDLSSNSGSGRVAGVSRPSDDVLRAQIAQLQVLLVQLLSQLQAQLEAQRR